jgi:polyhydroxybutyrate depolymerase
LVLLAMLLCCVVYDGSRASGSNGADTAGTLAFGGVDRTYQLHIPAGVKHPAGLVINLHGAGMTGASQAAATDYDSVADRYGFAVVYPNGIDMSWADGRGASLPDRQGVDDVGFLAALTDRLSRDYGVPSGRVFATGMSAGAFKANRLACDRRYRRRHRAGRGHIGRRNQMHTISAGVGAGNPRHHRSRGALRRWRNGWSRWTERYRSRASDG